MQENHKTELILFDLDGTLIDTAPDFHTSLNTMLKKYNMNEVSESDIRPHISEGTSKLIIARLPISVEANEDKCVFNASHSKRLIDSSSKVLSEYDFLE